MNWQILLAALIQVESGGDPYAIGDKGKALGCLQIHEAVVLDVNRIYDLEYVHTNMARAGWGQYSTRQSKEVCRLYLAYWGARYEGETGRAPTYEVYARIWNGGPRGYAKSATDNYWNKVQKEIELKYEGETK